MPGKDFFNTEGILPMNTLSTQQVKPLLGIPCMSGQTKIHTCKDSKETLWYFFLTGKKSYCRKTALFNSTYLLKLECRSN